MPGARSGNFRQGDKAELLAGYILSSLAFTVNVPRPEDIGYDFFCSLSTKQGDLEIAGPFFSVQSKKNFNEIEFGKDYQVKWIINQENPHFLCNVQPEDLTIELYSTWNVANGYLAREITKIVLYLDEQPRGEEAVQFPGDGTELHVYLGKPILHMTAADAQDETIVEERSAVLEEWIKLERENIANRQSGMYWVVGPLSYDVNEKPYKDGPWSISFYGNTKNLTRTLRNFTRNATHLRLLLNRFSDPPNVFPELVDPIGSLDAVLKNYAFALEPLAKMTLAEYIPYDIFKEEE